MVGQATDLFNYVCLIALVLKETKDGPRLHAFRGRQSVIARLLNNQHISVDHIL